MGENETAELSPKGENHFKVRGFRTKQKRNNHFSKHKKEYEEIGIKTPEELDEYATKQCESKVGGNIIGHIDGHHNVIRYNTETKFYAKGNPDLGVTTFFKPELGDDYYEYMKTEDLKHGGKD